MNYYKVAGHTFGVKLPDGDPLCSQLAQYEPFISPSVPDPIFVLSLADSLDDEGGELVYSGEPQSGEPIVRLFSTPGGWISEMAICPGRPLSAKLFMEKDFSAGKLLLLRPREALFSLNNALMLLYAFRTSGMHTLEMHASVIVNSGRAFLWLATSGTGKSTHSSLWLKNVPGSKLLNDDNPIVRVMEDGHVEVFGSPWSGKTPCYKNVSFPLGGIVMLSQAPYNKIRRLDGLEAYAVLVPSISGKRWDAAIADGLHVTENALASHVPAWHLACRPDEEAARLCETTISNSTFPPF